MTGEIPGEIVVNFLFGIVGPGPIFRGFHGGLQELLGGDTFSIPINTEPLVLGGGRVSYTGKLTSEVRRSE